MEGQPGHRTAGHGVIDPLYPCPPSQSPSESLPRSLSNHSRCTTTTTTTPTDRPTHPRPPTHTRLNPPLPPGFRYSFENAPVQKELAAQEVGNTAAFLVSPLSSAITGQVIFVDNGLSVMGLATDSKTLERSP